MNILFIGDIVGQAGREAVAKLVPALREELGLDYVIANGENAAAGLGITPRLARELFRGGCDALTLGDHVWDKQDIIETLETDERIVRPLNFPEGTPGRGWTIVPAPNGVKIGIINLLGRVFMRYNVSCPFEALRRAVARLKEEGVKVIIADMHAEATSEKVALGWFIDGEISALVGTHTHVPTADERVLPRGTAYVTDLGMTGPYESVIGQEKDKIIQRFITSIPMRFEVAKGDARLSGVLLDIDETTGLARAITRVQRPVQDA